MQPFPNAADPRHNDPYTADCPLPRVSSATDAVEATLDQLATLSALLDVEPDYAVAPLDFDLPPGFLLSVVIPVYNEEATLAAILARVSRVLVPKEIIVVDDCSTDGTREILGTYARAAGLRVLCKPRNEGKGAALRSGFAAARGDVIIVQDADLEYDPRDFPKLLKPIITGDADVVYGSRFLGDVPQDPSWLHRCGNALLTGLSNCFTGLSLTDMETCYKAFRREMLEGIVIEQNRFGFEPEVTAKLARRGARIIEVPITYRARSYADGKKIGIRDALNALYCIARYSGSISRTSTRLP
ncbi:MAG: glycosyltransferase family 2 protein [Pirellulaceae bacterium]|jgi:glycosyltransferase involved in cell wall biosynthesis|nr:glycosyltransferase family 2 protein [Pirellulaceae bacterium]